MPSDDLTKAFGQNLKAVREREGLTQEDLMRISGVHRTQISKFERGATTPELSTLLVLCSALNVGVAELLAGITWDPGPALSPREIRSMDEGKWRIN
jgi:transcriptional regulator with XRE-family HTH domain